MKNLFNTTLLMMILLMTGCSLNSFIKDNSMQDNIKPENAADHKLDGAFVYGTVDNGGDVLITGVIFMIKNSPDLYLPIKTQYTPFLIDVPFESTGIAKVAVRYNRVGSVLDHWILTEYNYTLSKTFSQTVTNETITILNRIVTNTKVTETITNVSITTVPQVYYIGRFLPQVNPKGLEDIYIMNWTNYIQKDQQLFLKTYPSLSNMDMIQMDVTQK